MHTKPEKSSKNGNCSQRSTKNGQKHGKSGLTMEENNVSIPIVTKSCNKFVINVIKKN